MIATDSREHFLRSLLDDIQRRVPEIDVEALSEYAPLFYHRVSLQDLEGRQIADVTGGLLASWRFLQQHLSGQDKVRVFNPDFDTHGWRSASTVMGIITENRPFVKESVRLEISRRNIPIHTIHHAILRTARNEQGELQAFVANDESPAEGVEETIQLYLEIGRTTDPEIMVDLRREIENILAEVRVVVEDHEPMRSKVTELAADLAENKDSPQLAETQTFLRWLTEDNFTFLGYEELSVNHDSEKIDVTRVAGSSLGLLNMYTSRRPEYLLAEIEQQAAEEANGEPQLKLSKSGKRSRVHRQAYPDYVELQTFNSDGQVVRECRILGLLTSAVYSSSPTTIPIVRLKVREILHRTGLEMRDFGSRDLLRVIESLPRDELFHSTTEELFETSTAIYEVQERPKVRLFVRRDLHGTFYSCLAYVPRELYNTGLRLKIQNLLCRALGAIDSEFTTQFSESILARTHFMLRVEPEAEVNFDVKVLEHEIVEIAQQWQDLLTNALVDEFGEEQGFKDANAFRDGFPRGYQDDFDPRAAVSDIKNFKLVEKSNSMHVLFHRVPGDAKDKLRFRLFCPDEPLALSDVIPILENMGMRVLGEHPYGIVRRDGRQFWIHDFSLVFALASNIKMSKVQESFQQAFLRIWEGDAESDSFNRLIAGAGLSWRETAVLRAYAHFMKQIRYHFSEAYIAATLSNHLAIAALLVELFKARFDPSRNAKKLHEDRIEEKITSALEGVENLNEDTIIRHYVTLIRATVRTNFFQEESDGEPKSYFSFKLDPVGITDLPLPRPTYEIFVYSPRVEGVHLRGGKVARGGLRWSDRHEDYRTEILGLVKAQQVKNAVIVPVGAKGGFVTRRRSPSWTREEVQTEGIACYQLFIQGLLDLTDNLVEGKVVPPQQVLVKDGDDPYLVVAADKGTASFSDIANELSSQYGFWLGDAFASGGSTGYDHKKMGITARGAWVSVQRHFREKGLNVQSNEFTVIGIGDMSGDVFGNGMLLSPCIQLLAAFNHQHIFLDPDPDAGQSFAERKRLFELPRSSWDDYDRSLISEGGGVFLRSAKSIPLSAQVRERLGIEEEELRPDALVSALLCAPVDLLWNGGIGTYVKASSESHAEVGDKGNDPVRVNANQLHCKVVGEGGNLGFTQLARVEYSLEGGAINSDFIDNSGGVDCSDHEVNIKILLNEKIAQGDLTEKQRVALLADMSDSVAELVLENNYRQANALSIAESESLLRIEEYRRLLDSLSASGYLNRELEFLPDDETLMERKGRDKGLSRPELSVLMAYVKNELQQQILDSYVPETPRLANWLTHAFPQQLRDDYAGEIARHKLRREIIATQLANDLVNHMGPIYMARMLRSTHASADNIVAAYAAAREIFQLEAYWTEIEALDNQVASAIQNEMMLELMRLIRQASRWLVQNRRSAIDPAQEIDFFATGVQEICEHAAQMLDGRMIIASQDKYDHYRSAGVSEALAGYMACSNNLISCLGVVEAAHHRSMPVLEVAKVNFELGDRLDLHWFARQITNLKVENDWQAMARESFLDEMEWQLRAIVSSCLRCIADSDGGSSGDIDIWLERQAEPVARWEKLMADLRNTEKKEFAMYTVALRGLLDLAQSEL